MSLPLHFEGKDVKVYLCEPGKECFSKKGKCVWIGETLFEIIDNDTKKSKLFPISWVQNMEEL